MELNVKLKVEKLVYVDGSGQDEKCIRCEMNPKCYYKVYGKFKGNIKLEKTYLLFCKYCLPDVLKDYECEGGDMSN